MAELPSLDDFGVRRGDREPGHVKAAVEPEMAVRASSGVLPMMKRNVDANVRVANVVSMIDPLDPR